jgi:hypothetical protein
MIWGRESGVWGTGYEGLGNDHEVGIKDDYTKFNLTG